MSECYQAKLHTKMLAGCAVSQSILAMDSAALKIESNDLFAYSVTLAI